MNSCLQPTWYIESDNPAILSFVEKHTAGVTGITERAVRLYYAVRDGFRYNPYCMSFTKEDYRASSVLSRGEGYCVQKAILLAAAARAAGVPCRLGFANVRNHLASEKLKQVMKTDLFVFHGYLEFQLDDRRVKATPAFDLALCERFGVLPLEFDGTADSLFHPFDKSGRRHMEYVHDYGTFEDFPFRLMIGEFRKYYAHLVADFPEFAAQADEELGADKKD
jgi:transglutaminase-like putative cysteine protease